MKFKTKFLCARCGGSFSEKDEYHIVGPADLRNYEEGTPVPDVGLYVCGQCYKEIRAHRT